MLQVARDLSQKSMSLLLEVLDRRDSLLCLWYTLDSQRIYTVLDKGKVRCIDHP